MFEIRSLSVQTILWAFQQFPACPGREMAAAVEPGKETILDIVQGLDGCDELDGNKKNEEWEETIKVFLHSHH